jgi:hypothetical protein
MAPRKDTEQSDDWRNQAGQSGQGGLGGNRQQGQRENLTGGNQQSDQGRGNKQSDQDRGNQQSDQGRGNQQSGSGLGQQQGSRDDLQDEEGGQRGNRGGRDQQR